jgi:hypothetical protein
LDFFCEVKELSIFKNLSWRSIKTLEQGQEDPGVDWDGKKDGSPLSGKESSQIRLYFLTSISALPGRCGGNSIFAFSPILQRMTRSRSSTTRIETLLRGLVEDIKSGRHEGSLISIETMKSVQEGNEDAWDEIRAELKDSGITEEEINENTQFIANYIIEAIQSHRAELGSLDAASFVTAAEGTGSLISGQTLSADRAGTYDFPGVEFRATKDLVHNVDHLYKGAPDDFNGIKDAIR